MPAFICISHSGELELKTAFLIYSLKKYLRIDYKIYVCLPDPTPYFSRPSDISLRFYHDLNIELCAFKNPLLENRRELLKGDLTSNKIYALSHGFKEDLIVFLDSDIVALQNFYLDPLISENQDLLIKPANRANIFSWEKIYAMVGQSVPENKVMTSIDEKTIPPYFNAGVIGIREEIKNIFWKTWAKYYERMWEEKDIIEFGVPPFHRDQVALSLAINDLNLKYSLLPEEYNFPLRGKKISKRNIPNLAHYHHPYAIYSTRIIKHEFRQFLKGQPEFEKLMKNYSDWEKLFGSNKIVSSLAGLRENLRYKKYIINNKIRKRI